jgi:Carboxypeptidase regulatory-like domain
VVVVVGLVVGCGGAGDGNEPTEEGGAGGTSEQGDAGSFGEHPEGGGGAMNEDAGGRGGAVNDDAVAGAGGASRDDVGAGDGGDGGAEGIGSSCVAEPDPLPGDELGDPNGCTYSGSVVVPGRSEPSGVRVAVVGTVLSAETDADGHFVIEGVPRGTRSVHFSYGEFHETLPEVVCGAGGVPTVGTFRLDAYSIYLYAGTRVSDGGPIRLSPPTADRVFYWNRAGANGITYVVDHECEPATQLPCSFPHASQDGSLVTCSADDGLRLYAVPSDATKSATLVSGTSAVARGSRYLAYTQGGSTRVLEVEGRRDRVVGTGGTFGVMLTPDDAHVLFVNAARDIMLGATQGDAPAVAVDSVAPPPPGTGTTFLPKFSPDGRYAAYVAGACSGPCALRLLDMDGNVRTLGTLWDRDSFQITPDSEFVVARLDSGAIVGYPTAGGAAVSYPQASSFFPAFLGDGSTMTLPADGATVLYDVATGDSLGETETGGVRVATPDGRFVLMSRQLPASPSQLDLVLWDTVALESHVIELDYQWSLPVVLAPDAKSAVFISGAVPSYSLKRVTLGAVPTVSTLATAYTFTRNLGFSSDGKLAFYADGRLRVAYPGGSPAVTIAERLDSQAELDWLGTSTIVTKLYGSPVVPAGVYALAVPSP